MGHCIINPPCAFPAFPWCDLNSHKQGTDLLYYVFSLSFIIICASCLTPCVQSQTVRQEEMLGYFGHETSDVVVTGWVFSPCLSVWSYFYSKADCSVSGCLYAISIIKGKRGLSSMPPSMTTPLCQSAHKWIFFPILLAHSVFLQVFLIQTISALSCSLGVFWLIYSSGWFIQSSLRRCDVGTDTFVRQIVCFRVLLKRWYVLSVFIVKFEVTKVDCLRHSVCVCSFNTQSWPQQVRRVVFYKRKWQNHEATGAVDVGYIWTSTYIVGNYGRMWFPLHNHHAMANPS